MPAGIGYRPTAQSFDFGALLQRLGAPSQNRGGLRSRIPQRGGRQGNLIGLLGQLFGRPQATGQRTTASPTSIAPTPVMPVYRPPARSRMSAPQTPAINSSRGGGPGYISQQASPTSSVRTGFSGGMAKPYRPSSGSPLGFGAVFGGQR